MSDSSFSELDEWLDRLLHHPREEWTEVADQLCPDADKRKALDALIGEYDRSQDFLSEASQSEMDDLLAQALDEHVAPIEPESAVSQPAIERYTVVRTLAANSHAVVYEVLRKDEHFSQPAALKVLRRTLDSDDSRRRFLVERQLMSALNHPHIATFLDAGTTDEGMPYFVSELVDGTDITSYVTEHQLGLRQRLELFGQVLEAVRYANSRMVIHRDVKPSNVMVNRERQVKLIDFGIARVLDDEPLEAIRVATRTHHNPLTPAYAAPEQLAGEEITTATDVYQLGLLLYELLSGRMAYDRTMSLAERQQHLSHNPPPHLPGTLSGIPYAAKRLRGDLDVICRKAMNYEPEARYASADALWEDINRFLKEQPIEARPPTSSYLVGKFMRRKPWVAPVAMVLVAALLGALSLQNHYLNLARAETDRANEIKSVLIDMLAAPGAQDEVVEGRGYDVTVLELLEHSSERIDQELAGQPHLQAELQGVVADMYSNLYFNEEALSARQKAIALELELYGEDSLPVFRSRLGLAALMARRDFNFDVALALEHLVADTAEGLGENHPLHAMALMHQAEYLGSIESVQEAVAPAAAAVQIFSGAGDQHADSLAKALMVQSQILSEHVDIPQALAASEKALSIYLNLYGESHVATARAKIRVAGALRLHDRPQEAARYHQQGLDTLGQLLGDNHFSTVNSKNNLALSYLALGQFDLAEKLLRECIVVMEENPDWWGNTWANNLQNLAVTLRSQGRPEEAIAMFERAKVAYQNSVSEDNYRRTLPDLALASAYLDTNDYEKARHAASQALTDLLRIAPDSSLIIATAWCRLGRALDGLQRVQEAQGAMAEGQRLLENLEVVSALSRAECKHQNPGSVL